MRGLVGGFGAHGRLAALQFLVDGVQLSSIAANAQRLVAGPSTHLLPYGHSFTAAERRGIKMMVGVQRHLKSGTWSASSDLYHGPTWAKSPSMSLNYGPTWAKSAPMDL